jgi:Calcineurin-like phosphoesterase
MRLWLTLLFLILPLSAAQRPWRFAVSGDSRNCGDVVMPAIARAAASDGAEFYWHLGDFRAMYTFDEDYLRLHESPTIAEYLANAWQDFTDHQLAPFGKMPVFLAIGNHELIVRTREQLLVQFADWFNNSEIRAQRQKDNPSDHTLRTYYHWVRDGIDFITTDNGSVDQFDPAQLAWINRVLAADKQDAGIRAVVVGMHKALPDSISYSHSMSESPAGIDGGRQVYQVLLDLRKGKPVYVLASHSHFFMDGTFNTAYWRGNGGVLHGWIIGTAGAVRYDLPAGSSSAKQAKTHVYGYLAATVTDSTSDPVQFQFHELSEADVPAETKSAFTPEFVHACWSLNPPSPK